MKVGLSSFVPFVSNCTLPCFIITGYLTDYNGICRLHDCKSVFPNLVCYYLMSRMFPSFLAKAFLAQLSYTQLVPPRCVSFSHRLSLKDILNTFQKHNHICRIDGILNKGRLKLKQYLGNRRDGEK